MIWWIIFVIHGRSYRFPVKYFLLIKLWTFCHKISLFIVRKNVCISNFNIRQCFVKLQLQLLRKWEILFTPYKFHLHIILLYASFIACFSISGYSAWCTRCWTILSRNGKQMISLITGSCIIYLVGCHISYLSDIRSSYNIFKFNNSFPSRFWISLLCAVFHLLAFL